MSEVATRTPQQQLVAQVRSPQFLDQVRIALPGNVTPDRFVRSAVTALMQNPDIAKAQPDTVIQSVIKCAQDGLLPDGREAALVLFGGKAVYMPMIGGFRKIAAEQGWSIRTQVVYDNDEFDYELGLDPRIVHRPVRPGQERGDPVAAYAVAAHRDGRREVEVLTREDIEKVRSMSRAKDSGPWRDWPMRMWEKTAGRRIFAKLPLEDRERVSRVVEASYEPADAAAALYGEPARAAYVPIEGEIVREDTSGVTPADGAAAADAGQQTDGADAASPAASPEAAPSVPDTDEPEPAPPAAEGQAAFEIPQPAVDEAAAFTLAAGNWEGWTIEAIAAEDSGEGRKYLDYVLRHPGKYDGRLVDAVKVFCAARLPELVGEDVQT